MIPISYVIENLWWACFCLFYVRIGLHDLLYHVAGIFGEILQEQEGKQKLAGSVFLFIIFDLSDLEFLMA